MDLEAAVKKITDIINSSPSGAGVKLRRSLNDFFIEFMNKLGEYISAEVELEFHSRRTAATPPHIEIYSDYITIRKPISFKWHNIVIQLILYFEFDANSGRLPYFSTSFGTPLIPNVSPVIVADGINEWQHQLKICVISLMENVIRTMIKQIKYPSMRFNSNDDIIMTLLEAKDYINKHGGK